jgi:iron complex outermembrane receptor protein
VSRAVRTPSRLDHDLATFTPANRVGNPDQKTEKLIAYEWGLRFLRGENFTADLTAFYNDYNDLRSSEAAVPVARFGNGVLGHTVGSELSLAWQPQDTLELRLFYAYLKIDLHADQGSSDSSTASNIESTSPDHQAGLRMVWQPAQNWSAAGFLRYVSQLNPANGKVPVYTDLNLRAAWRPCKNIELALVGENLFDPQHGEFRTPVSYTEVERSGTIEMIWTWD